jgi:hypothetical protein
VEIVRGLNEGDLVLVEYQSDEQQEFFGRGEFMIQVGPPGGRQPTGGQQPPGRP